MRFATEEDLPRIETMLRSYLQEEEDRGSPVRFTRKTLDWYRDLARAYVLGGAFGVVVLGEVDSEAGTEVAGFALSGEDPGVPRWDHSLGRVAVVWIAWVAREHRKSGIGLRMLHFGRPRLLELGFETAVMSVRTGNAEGQALTLGFGAGPAEAAYHFRLEEEPHGAR